MGESPTKKAVNGSGFPRRQSGLSVKDGNHEAESSQSWKGLSCSRKHDCTNRRQTTGKPKTTGSPLHASSSKDGTESSCRLISTPTNLKKTTRGPQTSREVNVLSNRNKQECTKKPVSGNKHSENTKGLQSSPLQNMAPEGQNFPATHPPRVQKSFFQRSDLGGRGHGSSGEKFVPRNSAPSFAVGESSVALPCSPRASSSRYSNMNCSSSSDVLPARFSTSRARESNRLTESNANESPARDNSTRKGKKIASSSSTAATDSKLSIRRHNVSFTSSPLSLEPRKPRTGCSSIRDGIRSTPSRQVASDIGHVRSEGRTSTISLPRTRLHSTLFASQLSNDRSACASINMLAPSPSSTDMSQPYLNSCETSESDVMVDDRASTDVEGSNSLGSHGSSQNDDGYGVFNLDGIAEVLLALERIEQDEELTYEQLLVIETNLFLSGLAFHDQHRDMRMDIDHMTYEELLALEEKMGSVSTAVSEEALSKCLRKSLYSSYPAETGTRTLGDDDVKCSVCQEEYADEDEVAHLPCDHRYHLNCINVWLRLKNWCPICKASVAVVESE